MTEDSHGGIKFEFSAFISYKREDEKWAKWLQRKLEHYRLPAKLCKNDSQLPKTFYPVFKDTTDIRPRRLQEELENNLKSSKFLIIICSPKSAKSEWVGKEIDYFINLARTENIILFIVDGEPYCNNPETECIHSIIKERLPEMLGVNVHEKSKQNKFIKKERSFIQVVSTMLDVNFDSLWQRQRRSLIRRMIGWILLLLFFITTVGFVWQATCPIDMTVKLNPAQKAELPFPELGMKLTVKLANQDQEKTVFDTTGYNLAFTNIPSKYKRIELQIVFTAAGYHSIDTFLLADEAINLPIARDERYFGTVRGVVRSRNNDAVVKNVLVTVEGVSTVTNKDGEFELFIPFVSQHDNYVARIERNGNITMHNEIQPAQSNSLIINTLYIP